MSADEYTPTKEEVRSLFDAARLRYAGAKDGDLEFDRWLAAHDAEVARTAKAEALEEVADEYGWASNIRVGVLRARAAEYRKVATDE